MGKENWEQQLLDLCDKGKISKQEYEDLLADIQRRTIESEPSSGVFRGNLLVAIPWQIWVIIGLLVWDGIGELAMIPKQPGFLLFVLARCLFIFGFIKRIKWIYCLFIIACVANAIYLWPNAIHVTLINGLLIGLVLWKYRFYFPESSKIADEPAT